MEDLTQSWWKGLASTELISVGWDERRGKSLAGRGIRICRRNTVWSQCLCVCSSGSEEKGGKLWPKGGERGKPRLLLCLCFRVSLAQHYGHLPVCSVASNSLSVGTSRQEYWSGLPFPSSGDLPDPGIKPTSPASLAFAGRYFTPVPRGKPLLTTGAASVFVVGTACAL